MINQIRKMLHQALGQLSVSPIPEIEIERARREEHGHFSSNIAMQLAGVLKQSPLSVAEELVSKLPAKSDSIEKVTVAKPGFINFFLTPQALQAILPEIKARGDRFGKSDQGKGKTAQVEFVSANPTGPLTVGHGRQAVLGDCIARILEWNGYAVDREYYYNDAGRQMRILGRSVFVRYKELLGYAEQFPDDFYHGDYIREVAQRIVDTFGEKYLADPDHKVFREYAEAAVFKNINATLQRLNIRFDRYYNEKSLYESQRIDQVLEKLKAAGATYEKDGAVWFKAGDYGGTDDRVLWKSVADEATYRLPDIAYHETKFQRDYDLIVDVFGADHHATYPDVIAGLQALGYDVERIKVIIHQFVTLMRSGKKVKMSTRKATYVTLDELIGEVGKDVVRYFFIMRNAQSHLNFDLDLAKTEGEENPVFYLQYAYARICSILRKAQHRGVAKSDAPDSSLLTEPETLNLLFILSEFKEIVALGAQTFEPQQITGYLQKLATAFHKFYSEHQVLSKDAQRTQARLELVEGVQQVLANGLRLIGITAPERM